MPQHPFTPEPREPEPWPERELTPWEWAESEAKLTGGECYTQAVADEDLERIERAEAENVEFWYQRGWSIGFGEYSPPSDYEVVPVESLRDSH